MGEEIHYLNGKWVKEEDCKISVFDLTVLRGYGVFDFLRTYQRKPFLLEDHIERLFKSAETLGITIPKEKKELEEMVLEGIRRSTFSDIYIKLIVTGGVSADGISKGNPSIVGLFLKSGSYPESCISEGIALRLLSFERPLPHAKSLNYMTAVVALQDAKKIGASDVLYVSYDNHILEGTTNNFFAVIDNKIYTTDDMILFGITRKFILKLLKELGIEVIIGHINKNQISNFQEAFITSTTREIHPVVKIDDAIIGKGVPGETTKKIMNAFSTAKILF